MAPPFREHVRKILALVRAAALMAGKRRLGEDAGDE
jgi:hypothetical protein